MAEQTPSPDSDRSLIEAENYQDYAGAMRTIASARSLFLLLLILSLLIHAGAFALARWSPDLLGLNGTAEHADEPLSADGAPDPIREPTNGGDRTPLLRAGQVRGALEAALPVMAFVGLASCILLLGCYLLSVNVALSGRLGGVRGSLAAFFWMVVVLLLMLPWERCTCNWVVPVPGVYVTADEIMHLPTSFASTAAEVAHYVRFLGYPLLVLLVLLAGDRRYARGYRLADRQVEARLAVRRV